MSEVSAVPTKDTLSTPAFNARVIPYQLPVFLLHSFLTIVVFGLQVVPGLIVKSVFDTISGEGSGTLLGVDQLWGLIGLYFLVELARLFLSIGSEWYGWTFRLVVGALLRSNLFASILRRRGDRALPVSSGEALNRFGSDVGEVGDFPLWLPDQVGKWIAAVIAVVIMARINLTITLVIFLPLIGIIFITRLAWGRILNDARECRHTDDVTMGFLGEVWARSRRSKWLEPKRQRWRTFRA